MKILITDNVTGIVTECEVAETVETVVGRESIPTVEERLASVETDVDEIVTVLGTMDGVTV